MNEWTILLVAGLATGSIYALAALGLVVTYTTSGVFNFAHGAVGIFTAFVFESMRTDMGVPALPALVVCVLVIAPLMGAAIDVLFLRRLEGASSSTYVVVSLGLLVAMQGLVSLVFGSAATSMEPFLPTSTYGVGGVRVGWDQTIVVAVAATAGAALFVFFRRTALGLRMRAVVDDGPLTELVGVEGRRVKAFSWMLGASFASLSAILLAPFIGLDAAILTLLIVRAFGAAVVGRLTSLPLTYAGGIGIGIAEALSTKLAGSHPSLIGLPPGIPFLVLFAVLVMARKGRFVEVVKDRRSAASVPTLAAVRPLLVGAVLVALVVLPARLGAADLLTATSTLIFFLLFVSLRLLVGLSRQVSLCHAVFVALGATSLANFVDAGIPYLLALVLAGLVLVPVGMAIAIPSIRLSGLFLALATFGFGVLVQSLVFTTALAFGPDGLITIPRPELFGISLAGDKAFYFFVLIVVALGVAGAETVTRSRLGRVLRAVADSPTGTESLGIRVTTARVSAFCLSAFLAGIVGALLGSLFLSVNSSTYGFNHSLLWLTVLVTAGSVSLFGSAAAAFLLVAVPALVTSGAVTDYQPVVFGLLAVLLAQAPDGLAGFWRSPRWSGWAANAGWRRRSSPTRWRLAAREAAS